MTHGPVPFRLIDHIAAPIPTIPSRTARWDRSLDAAVVPTDRSAEQLARLHRPEALAVTTGQQPGLFTGPLYTIHKALAAAALARRLEQDWGRPVVPIFWLAGDDHDFLEASGAGWLDASGRLDGWHLPARDEQAVQRSMSQEPLPGVVVEGLAHLQDTLPPGPFTDNTLAWLRRHYHPGTTILAAYAGALAEMLAPYGVLCLDATHVAVKKAQRSLVTHALTHAAELDATLAALPEAGTGIRAGDGATLVFLETTAGRDRLLSDGTGVQARRSGERWSREQILTLLDAEPERFSANVLLRPIVERAILPTVAYVAGPGEHRYLTAQAASLYSSFGQTPQVPVPRWGGTVVEPWVERLLGRLELTAEQVLTDDGTLARAIIRRDMPEAVTLTLAELRRQIAETESTLLAAGHELDPVLDRAVAGRARKWSAVADDMERLFERHLRKRDDVAHAQWRRVVDALRPGGAPQERHLTAATFLSRYGSAWLDAIVDATNRWAGVGHG